MKGSTVAHSWFGFDISRLKKLSTTSKNDLIFSYDASLQSFHYSQKATANESTNCNKEYFINAKGKMFMSYWHAVYRSETFKQFDPLLSNHHFMSAIS